MVLHHSGKDLAKGLRGHVSCLEPWTAAGDPQI
jgi:hypothetical protein